MDSISKSEQTHMADNSKLLVKLEIASKIVSILSSIGILVAVITLITNLYPQLIPGNSNLINKANAGHVKSQMQLAEHYYEVGEYDDAIYWYKIASTSSGKYQPIACNNLGFLYAEGYGFSDNIDDSFYRFEKALHLFSEAYDTALQNDLEHITTAIEHNGIDLLRYYSDECFPNSEDYGKTEKQWKEDADSQRVVISVEYKSFETSKGKTYSDGNTKYFIVGTYVGPSENGGLLRTYYRYYAVTYAPNTDPYEPQFIQLSELKP